MTSSNGSVFRVTDPLCGELMGHRWIPLTKAGNAELWCFLWAAPWIDGWVNNREAGDLRRHRTHYDVVVLVWRCHGSIITKDTNNYNRISRAKCIWPAVWSLQWRHKSMTGPQITSNSTVSSKTCSDWQQRKHKSLYSVKGNQPSIGGCERNPPMVGPMRKAFPWNDVTREWCSKLSAARPWAVQTLVRLITSHW